MVIRKIRGIEESKLYYVLIVLFCMNFLGRGSIVCTLFSLFSILKLPKKIAVDAETIFVFFLCVSAFAASLFYNGIIDALKCVNYFFLYFAGLNGFYATNNKNLHLKRTLFSVYLGYAFLVGLSFYSSITSQIYNSRQYLMTTNFWTGEELATTLVGLISSVTIGYSFYGVFFEEKRKKRVLVILSLVVVLYTSIATATRTPIALFLLVWFLMLSIYITDHRRRRVRLLLFLLVVLFLLLLLSVLPDFFGIKNILSSLPIYDRLLRNGLQTSRGKIALEHFSCMFDYLWGGNYIEGIVGYTAHNYIQQGHDLYGIIATISLILLEFSFIKNIILLIAWRNKSDIDYLLISLYASMLIAAHLEPIFTGYPCFFYSLLLIHGMTNGYLRTKKYYYKGDPEEN